MSKRILFPVLAVVLAIAVVLGIPELVVRIASPKLDRYTAILFGQDPRSPELFMRDARLGWKLRPGVEVRFLETRVRTNHEGFRGAERSEGGRRVLCLGDSTTFGWRVDEAAAYPFRLEASLRSAGGGAPDWSVANAGVPGYSSFQVRRLAEDLLPRLRPDVVVLCTGNNDGWPSRESDAAYFERTRGAARIDAIVSKSRFVVWLRERLARDPESLPLADVLAAGLGPRVARDAFLENVWAVVEAARAAGATPIVLAPPANVYEHPVRAEFPPEMRRRLERNEPILALASSGRAEEAVALSERLLREDPTDFQGLWIHGIALLNLGRFEEGRRFLDDALEAHPAPASLKPSWRRELRALAEREGVLYLDANEVLEREIGRVRPADLYIDWCHPTPAGHERIAEALAAWIPSPAR